jgi:hypothetical protein
LDKYIGSTVKGFGDGLGEAMDILMFKGMDVGMRMLCIVIIWPSNRWMGGQVIDMI